MASQYKQKGIALFQVLLMTAIIAVLALQFTQTAKNQVAIATIMADRVKAELTQKSAESAVIFALLTEPLEKNTEAGSLIANQWNFFNKAFTLKHELSPSTAISPTAYNTRSSTVATTLAIQDMNGLVTLYRGGNVKLVARLLKRFAVTDADASIIVNSLVDWQDFDSLVSTNGAEKANYNVQGMPSNMPLQSFSELLYVKGMTPMLAEKIKPFVTIRPQGYFNPMNAPKEVLSLLVPSEKVDNIIRLRDNESLTINEFALQSGIATDEGLYFYTSGLLRITLKTEVNDVVLTKQLDVFVQPNNKYPYIEYGIQH